MKRIMVLISLGSLSYFPVLAQKYGTAFGLRFANDDQRMLGITVEQRLLKHITLEGIIQSDFNSNTTAHALVKRHIPILTKRLNLFTGAGLSLGNEESIGKDPATREVVTTYGNKTLNADLIIGAELTILKMNVSLDYKPNINIAGRDNWYKDQVGISVRTVLIKDSTRKKKQRKKERAKRRKERLDHRENKQGFFERFRNEK